jgi:hypothetical protein
MGIHSGATSVANVMAPNVLPKSVVLFLMSIIILLYFYLLHNIVSFFSRLRKQNRKGFVRPFRH